MDAKQSDVVDLKRLVARLEAEGKRYGNGDTLTEMIGGEKFSYKTRSIVSDMVDIIFENPELAEEVPSHLREFFEGYKINWRSGMKREARELLQVAKELCGDFVDNPGTLGDQEDELERVREEAEAKLVRECEVVGGRYYWSPGKSVMMNMTLTGRPLMHVYSLRGLGGASIDRGSLMLNPSWVSQREDAMPSYKWGFYVDKIISMIKDSQSIKDKIEKDLDEVERAYGEKLPTSLRAEAVNWCVKVAKGRLGVKSYPGPRGKFFDLKERGLYA